MQKFKEWLKIKTDKYSPMRGILIRWFYVAVMVLLVATVSIVNQHNQQENKLNLAENPEIREIEPIETQGEAVETQKIQEEQTQNEPETENEVINPALPDAKTNNAATENTEGDLGQAIAVEAQTGKIELTMPAAGTWDRAYGYGYDETYNDYRFHGGVDMYLAMGTLVSAVAAGTVTSIETEPGWGQVIKIDHGGGLVSVYAGLEILNLQKGDSVVSGVAIGKIIKFPANEKALQPHLHLELWLNGTRQNPADYFS